MARLNHDQYSTYHAGIGKINLHECFADYIHTAVRNIKSQMSSYKNRLASCFYSLASKANSLIKSSFNIIIVPATSWVWTRL